MKKLFLFAFIMISWGSFAQVIKIDTINFVKPEAIEPVLDASITGNLEQFKDKDDAIIYLYRLSSMAGAAVKWKVQVDNNNAIKLGQKEFITAHINATEKSHWISYPDFKYNYVNFKPNKYYFIMLKGFQLKTGYLDKEAYIQIKTCKIPKELTK
jgi:hypothetical protein